MQKYQRFLFVLLFLVVCGALLFAVGWFLVSGGSLPIQPLPSDSLVVSIVQPTEGTQILSGQVLIVQTLVESNSGIKQVDLLIDGVTIQSYVLPDPAMNQLEYAFVYFSSQTGWHQVEVLARDSTGRFNKSSIVHVAVLADVGEDIAGGESSQDGNAPDSGNADQPENPNPPDQDQVEEGDGQQADGEDAAPPFPLPPQPVDAVPQITHFDVVIEMVAPEGDGEPIVNARAVGSAQDDLGLVSLQLSWHGGDIQDNGNFVELCNGQLQCETEFALPLAVGQWFFTLQAVDTSGQRSVAAVNLAEILPGGEDLPPAAVDHDLDPAVFDDVINDPLAGLNGDIFLPIGEGLNVIDLMDWLANAEDEAPPEEECAQGDWVCEYGKGITVTVEPRVDGNFITLQVDQAFEAPEGKVLVPRIMKSFSNHNITSLNFPPEWVAGQGAIIQPGAVFTWLDSDIVCGEAYTYTIGINAFAPNEVENYLAGQGYPVGSTIAYEMHTATSQRCGEDAFGQPSLTADVTPEGVELNWSLPAGDDWPAEGAGVILIRWNQTQVNPNEQDSVNLFEQQISQADLRAGRQFQFVDPNLECGNQYVYLLGVYDVNQRPGFSPDGWLAHTSIPAPLHFCPEGELTNIFLHLTSTWDEWVNGDYQKVEIDFDIPAGFRWPNGNNVRLTLWQAYTNENGEYVTEDIGFFPYRAGQNNNFHRNFSQAVDCSRERYDFFLTLESDGTVLNESRSYHIELPSCPPKEPPDLTQLSATNECLGVEQCIVVTWAPFQPADEPPYEPAIKLLVERKSVFAGEWISVEMPSMELTSYQDSDMACTGSYLYRIVAVDAHGFRSSSPALQINTPACDQPWSVVVFPESE